MSQLPMLAAAGIIGALIVIVLVQSSMFGIIAILTPFILRAAIGELPGINVGPITLFVTDVVFLPITVATIVRLLSGETISKIQWMWIGFGALGLFAFARGAATFGLLDAGVSYRNYFYLFGGVLYFMTFPIVAERLNRVAMVWIGAGVVLSVIALWRWVSGNLEVETGGVLGALGGYGKLRVINANAAFVIAEAALICVYIWLRPQQRNNWMYLALILLPIIVFLNHRTVWVVFLITAILLRPPGGHRGAAATPLIAGGAIVAFVVLVTMAGSDGGVLGSSLAGAVTEPFSGQSSLAWRYAGWEDLILNAAPRDALGILFGQGFGSSFLRNIGLNVVHVSPHNYYLQTYLLLGATGLLAWLVFYYVCLKRLKKLSHVPVPTLLDPAFMWVIMIGQLIFIIPYTPNYEQSIFIGIAARMVMQLRDPSSTELPKITRSAPTDDASMSA